MISPTGSAEVCCQITPHFDKPRPRFDNGYLFQKEYKEIGQDFKDFKKSKTEWLDGCHGCRLDEERDGISARANTETVFCNSIPPEDNSIYYATVNAGNICNLACKMCESGPSSKWGSIARNHPNPWISERGLRGHEEEDQQYVIDYVLTPKLQEISLGGGEPLMNPIYLKYLNTMLEKDIAKNIKFKMITNGTFELPDVWKSALQEFKSVEIMFSMDGTFDNYNYIRTHADFDQVITNIKNIRDIVLQKGNDPIFGIAYVAQALNAHKINYDEKWFNDNLEGFDHSDVNFMSSPSYLSLCVVKPELLEKYDLENEIENFDYDEEKFFEFIRFNAFWDKINKTSLEKQNPDFFDTRYYPDIRSLYEETYSNAK